MLMQLNRMYSVTVPMKYELECPRVPRILADPAQKGAQNANIFQTAKIENQIVEDRFSVA